MATRKQDLADAYVAVAKANHYMVGIVGTVTAPITREDREGARAILIDWENSTEEETEDHARIKLALDLLEHDERQATLRASRGEADKFRFRVLIDYGDGSLFDSTDGSCGTAAMMRKLADELDIGGEGPWPITAEGERIGEAGYNFEPPDPRNAAPLPHRIRRMR